MLTKILNYFSKEQAEKRQKAKQLKKAAELAESLEAFACFCEVLVIALTLVKDAAEAAKTTNNDKNP